MSLGSTGGGSVGYRTRRKAQAAPSTAAAETTAEDTTATDKTDKPTTDTPVTPAVDKAKEYAQKTDLNPSMYGDPDLLKLKDKQGNPKYGIGPQGTDVVHVAAPAGSGGQTAKAKPKTVTMYVDPVTGKSKSKPFEGAKVTTVKVKSKSSGKSSSKNKGKSQTSAVMLGNY